MKSQRFIKGAVFLAVILSGLSAGLSLSHVLEIPGKHRLTAVEFLKVHHTFYGGYAIFGSIAWVYCCIAGIAVGLLLFKSSKPLAGNALAAGIAFGICLLIFAIFLSRYNKMIASWTVDAPVDWWKVRNHWELSHAIVFVISTVAFICFLRAWGKFIPIKFIRVAR